MRTSASTESQRGHALYIVLVAVLTLTAIGTSVTHTTRRVPLDTRVLVAEAAALAAADGGVEWALANIADGSPETSTVLDVGSFSVVVEIRAESVSVWNIQATARGSMRGLPVVRSIRARASTPPDKRTAPALTHWASR